MQQRYNKRVIEKGAPHSRPKQKRNAHTTHPRRAAAPLL
nr:MAG TPA: hypothetical protein [Caudoviricetes sp.]